MTRFYKGEIINTEDGSCSIRHELLNDSYHSSSGALLESEHIYIQNGLLLIDKSSICIFEMGLGTGLNMLLSIEYALKNNIKIEYHCVELYPLCRETIISLNYSKLCSMEAYELFLAAHNTEWDTPSPVELHPNFAIRKYRIDIRELIMIPNSIDIVYYDAFSPETQPELWSSEIFSTLYLMMNSNSILMTYSSRGTVKQALRDAGFEVKRIAGPGRKRHILRATKS